MSRDLEHLWFYIRKVQRVAAGVPGMKAGGAAHTEEPECGFDGEMRIFWEHQSNYEYSNASSLWQVAFQWQHIHVWYLYKPGFVKSDSFTPASSKKLMLHSLLKELLFQGKNTRKEKYIYTFTTCIFLMGKQGLKPGECPHSVYKSNSACTPSL